MDNQATAVKKNAFFGFLMQLSPAARVGLVVFLLALAMLAAGLGVRSATHHFLPFDSSEPPLMVYAATSPASSSAT